MGHMGLRKGFTCDCGEKVRYPGYVYAHWDIPLIYTCEKCGQQWAIIKGANKRLKTKKPAPPVREERVRKETRAAS